MAKASALELVNKILENLGELSNLTVLTSLSGLSLMVFNTINEVLYDLNLDDYNYSPLEEDGTITLSTGVPSAAIPTDMYDFDKDSFRLDNDSQVKFYTPQKMDREYVCQTNTGTPGAITRWKDVWKFMDIPSSTYNGKTIKFRYWKVSTRIATATPAGTCWIPEGFDLTMLADLVTYKIMHYKHNEEVSIYYAKVFGDAQNKNEGSLARFKALYGSPRILDDNIMCEPM